MVKNDEELLSSTGLPHAGSIMLIRESADEELVCLVEFQDSVMANMEEGLYTVDPQGRVTYLNPAAERLFGWNRAELIGRSIHDVTHFKHPDGTPFPIEECAALQVLRHGNVLKDCEDVFIRQDGSFLPVIYNCSPLRSRNKVVGLVVVFRNLAERRLAEDARLRTLKESDRRKDEFLALLAHELRNPLAPIRNSLQILRLTQHEGAAEQAAVEMMERQVAQLVRLVNDLLDVNRITRGKIELRRERFDLNAAVRQAVEAAQAQVDCMEDKLTLTLPQQPLYVSADPTRLAQIVDNLLSNACKFMEKGGHIVLTVEQEGHQAAFRVRDTGIGIAPEHLPRIFEMFTQLQTPLARSQSGLGIGLALVKDLVELHGGTIEVHSAGLGQGTEFVVRLPLMLETGKPTPIPVIQGPKPVSGKRILVVDDNRDAAASLAALFNFSGNETQAVYDGLAALAAAAVFRPDIIFLDIGLPRLNGYEVARTLRAMPWGTGIIMVALTGWGQEEDRRLSKVAGFNAHIVKPVDYPSLMKLLNDLQYSLA